MIRRLAFLIGALRGLRDGAAARPADEREHVDPRRRELPHDPRAELIVALLLLATGALGVTFAVAIALRGDTQVLGLALGGALACLSAALILAGKRVFPQEVEVEHRTPMSDPVAEHDVAGHLAASVDGISRRRLLAGAAGAAGVGLAAAAALPAASLGPGAGVLGRSPWRHGTRLMTSDGRPLRAQDIPLGSFETAFPEGADPRELGSPVVLVHIAPETIDLPPERRGWAHGGILAFSKICTHAGCAVSLFRYPVDEDTSKGPALVCPCHYSTFDVRKAARPIFGPAVRALPQLPIYADASGELRAGGPLSGSVGPSWWRVDRT
jgi:ubiquinol-cytochrome c reductase iron-sulfur subunit